MKLKMCEQIFEGSLNMKFRQHPSTGSRVVQYGRTQTVGFRNFANAPKKLTSFVVMVKKTYVAHGGMTLDVHFCTLLCKSCAATMANTVGVSTFSFILHHESAPLLRTLT